MGREVQIRRIAGTSRGRGVEAEGGSGMIVGMRDNIKEISPQNPSRRTNGESQQVHTDPMVSLYLTGTQQTTSLLGEQVEGVDLFNRI